jgi:hypothetical protein
LLRHVTGHEASDVLPDADAERHTRHTIWPDSPRLRSASVRPDRPGEPVQLCIGKVFQLGRRRRNEFCAEKMLVYALRRQRRGGGGQQWRLHLSPALERRRQWSRTVGRYVRQRRSLRGWLCAVVRQRLVPMRQGAKHHPGTRCEATGLRCALAAALRQYAWRPRAAWLPCAPLVLSQAHAWGVMRSRHDTLISVCPGMTPNRHLIPATAAKEKLIDWYPIDTRNTGAAAVAIAQLANASYTDRLLRTTAIVYAVASAG